MTPAIFREWREKVMRLSREEAAEALDVSVPTIKNYELGHRPDGKPSPIPRSIAFSCTAIYHRLKPWKGEPE